jgi:hypothetical protein
VAIASRRDRLSAAPFNLEKPLLRPKRLPTRVLALLALAGLPACALIDQTTFAPDPEPPLPAQVANTRRADRRVPLLTVRYDVPNPTYENLLRYAVQAAQARDPNLEYDVVTVVPGRGGPVSDVQALQQSRQGAVEIMRAIMQLGVPDSRIHLGARTDPAATAREVRVYVR